MSDPETVNWAQTAWTGAMSLFGGFALLIAKRTSDTLDSKADKNAVDKKFVEIQQDFRDMMDRHDRERSEDIARQDRQHADNSARMDVQSARLDNIWRELIK